MLITTFTYVQAADLTVGDKNSDDISKWMDNYISTSMNSAPAAGVGILVANGKDIVLTKSYGHSNIESNLVSNFNDVYQIGSITKQFTAVSILMLEEQGKLSLDDDITKYLPNYPTQGKKITIANLLYHTSGIKNYIKVGHTDSKMAPGRKVNQSDYILELRPDEMMNFFQHEPLEFSPGDNWNYSNSGYFLAGLIIEKVSGLTYEDFIETHLMAKASMTNSSYTNYEEIVPNRAKGYKIKNKKLLNADPLNMSVPYAAGALSSTLNDLLKWNNKLHTSDKLLGKNAYKKLITPGALNNGNGLPLGYALGIAVSNRDGHVAIMHPGGINGFSGILVYFPKQQISVIVLSNTYEGTLKDFVYKLEMNLSAYLLDADVTKFSYLGH